jgi:hypothetical protein
MLPKSMPCALIGFRNGMMASFLRSGAEKGGRRYSARPRCAATSADQATMLAK